MKAVAKLRNAQISAQKCRLVADQIRLMPVTKAIDLLTFSPKKAAGLLKTVLTSAIGNAEDRFAADVDELFVERVYVDEGATLKRMRPRAKGRGCRILKRSCHITVELASFEE